MQVIIGSNYGDEGKGSVTSYFSNNTTINILTNGGAQRGHTAIYNGIRHVFHHFGSGTLKGAVSYFFKDFLIDPVTFLNELEELNSLGINPIVYRDENCRWVTPYDVIVNQELERHRENKHGSCGMGIWETIKRYNEMSCINIDSFNNMRLYDKYEYLDKIRYRAWSILESNDALSKDMKSILETQDISKRFIEDVESFCTNVSIKELYKIIPNYERVIFENAQGLLLNSDKNNIHTTPSETGCKNIVDFIEENFNKEVVEIIYVTRPYLTRHGVGKFVKEVERETLNADFDETNIYNEFQGYIRYGELSINKLLERIGRDFSYTCFKNNNYIKSLAITHLDELFLNLKDYQKYHFYNIYKFRKDMEINPLDQIIK